MGLKYSKLTPRQTGELVKLFVAGSTARTAANLVGVHRNTAALFFSKVRAVIAAHQEVAMADAFNGPVEIDESYFGGRRKGKRGRGAAGKVAVFGILRRGGEVFAQMIADCGQATLVPIIRRKVAPRIIGAKAISTVLPSGVVIASPIRSLRAAILLEDQKSALVSGATLQVEKG